MTHPELVRVEDLVRRLQDGMDEGGEGVEKSLFSLAAEFADLCKRTNDRLQTCVEILSKGKDKEYQALMTATRAPDVLDLVAVLGELEADEYRTFCKQNHLPVAEPLNERAKQTIDPIYERAGSFQKNLMAEYSAANSKRDFKEALRVIRRVASLNPDDVNSVKQAQALEDRLVRDVVAKLDGPLKDGNTDAILGHLVEIEELAPGRIPRESDKREGAWRKALGLRAGLLREAAIRESETLMESAQGARETEDLDEVLTLISRVSGLMAEHEFMLKPNLRNLHAELSEWGSEEIRKLKLEDDYQGRLEVLRTTVKTIRDKEFQNVKPTLSELQEDALNIRKQWKEISEFQKPVPNELQEEARKTLADLEEKVALKQRAKRRNLITGVSAGSVTLIILAVIAFFFWKAGQKAEQLERALAGERASDLERNLDELKSSSPMWKGLAGLPSTVERARTWLNLEKANADRVDEMITGIENDFKAIPDPAAWTEVSLVAVRGTLDESREQSTKVNPDFQSNMADRLLSLEQNFERITEEKRNSIAPEFHAKVLALDAKLRDTLGSEKSPVQTSQAVTEMAQLISDMDILAESELEELKPLAADLTTFDILKQKYASLEENAEEARKVMSNIAQASNLSDYVTAVTGMEDTDFLEGTDKIALGNLLRKVRSEEVILREVLMPDDLVLWTKISDGKFSSSGFPAVVEGAEKGLILGLRDDELLAEVYKYSATESGKTRDVFSRGEPMNMRNSKLGDTTQTEAIGGKVYDPGKMGKGEASFGSAKYRSRISNSGSIGYVPIGGKLAPESTLFQSLRLGGYIDPTVSNYRDSLLKAVESLFDAEADVSPLFKAYVHLRIGEIVLARREEWLIDFTEFDKHYEELDALTGNGDLTSASWMVPSEIEQYRVPLSEFYQKYQGIQYAKPAAALQQFYARILASGIEHCGYVDFEGNHQLVKPTGTASELWGADKDLNITRILTRDGEDWKPLTEIRPFSPIFFFTQSPESVVEAAAESAGISPGLPEYRNQLPLVFQGDGN